MTLRPSQPVSVAWDAGPAGTTGYLILLNGRQVSSTRSGLSARISVAAGDTVSVVAQPSGQRQEMKLSWGAAPTPTPTPPPTPGGNPVPPPASGCYFGAYIEGRVTYNHDYAGERTWDNVPWDAATWDRFERNAGKPARMLMTGSGHIWQGSFGDLDFILNANAQRGTIPVIDVDTTEMGTLADIAAGKHDALIDAAAAHFKSYGKPCVVRFDAEMNGGWYRFGEEIRASAAGPGNFNAAYRRVVTRFRAAGAANVSWHWCPNVDQDGKSQFPIEQLYPGDDVVDWTGFTGYNHGNEGVDFCFANTYARVQKIAPSKPMMIGEIASVDLMGPAMLPRDVRYSRAAAQAHIAALGRSGVPMAPRGQTSNPSKAQWINDLAAWLPAHPAVKAFCWFNWRITENGYVWDWEIESSPAALAAFKTFAASSYIVGR